MNPVLKGKARVQYHIDCTEITISSPKNWLLFLFVTAWLFGWYLGFDYAITLLEITWDDMGEPNIFVMVWLFAWTFVGAIVFLSLLWGFLGQEKITLESNFFRLKKSILGLGKTWVLNKSGIQGIHFEGHDDFLSKDDQETDPWGLTSGKVYIDYGYKTYHLGMSLPNKEAMYLVEILKEHLA